MVLKYLTVLLIGLVVILFIASIIWLLDNIKKITTNRTKYRIIKSYSKTYNESAYIIQERYLWFFWIYVGEYCTSVYALEEVKSQIERLKRIKTKKEVLYEE